MKALVVNRANDRHGELENETAAIAWLFSTREAHMRNLTKDIVERGQIYELPLVSPDGSKFVVFDGNRRVTCLKLLEEPRRAPTTELQDFFREQRSKWKGKFSQEIHCQVEADKDRIDDILFRRHTGTQNGVGQSNWDDRMKATFVERTGKGGGLNVADEIEKRLAEANLLPTRRKIPRSTMNRLLSAEPFRNRLGFSASKGQFSFTHDESVSLAALARVADDLACRRLVLGDIWDVDGKRKYLNDLEHEGVLPTARDALSKPKKGAAKPTQIKTKPTVRARPSQRRTLIPQTDFGIVWPGRLQRHHQIWEELQFHLELGRHANAISVLFRVLLELSVENYLNQTGLAVNAGDKLAARVLKVGKDMQTKGILDQKQVGVLVKFQHSDKLVSADTLNRYVHSASFAPSPEHLASLWDSLAEFIVQCLKA
ncbi:hypothetical protein [Nitratireductor sp.]|uniref:hypothetical protein n=1 Tax=Nitratireductor sp. TaxID=1872084 RepID=UPI002605FF65|nr:hypothetical protein [Nitratireductor sp.]